MCTPVATAPTKTKRKGLAAELAREPDEDTLDLWAAAIDRGTLPRSRRNILSHPLQFRHLATNGRTRSATRPSGAATAYAAWAWTSW